MVCCPNYVTAFHKGIVFQHICLCFYLFILLSPLTGQFTVKTTFSFHTDRSNCLHLFFYTQDVNWTNWTFIRCSEDVLDAFWTSYVRSVYILYLWGIYQIYFISECIICSSVRLFIYLHTYLLSRFCIGDHSTTFFIRLHFLCPLSAL